MPRSLASLTLLSIFLPVSATAQITITADEYQPAFGEFTSLSFVSDNPTGIEALVNATGGNQTYDFTAFPYGDGAQVVIDILPLSSSIPGSNDPAFAGADYVAFSDPAKNPDLPGTLYAFFSVDNDGLYTHGSIAFGDFDMDGTEDMSTSKITPPEREFFFPLTDGTSWTSTSSITTDALGTEVTTEITTTSVVDGWGTLITPAGQAPCLRLSKTLETSLMGTVISTSRFIEFVTEETLSASITLDPITGLPIAAGYATAGQGGGNPTSIETASADVPDAFHLDANYPNPFNPGTTILFGLSEAGHVTLTVYDVLGQAVATLVNEALSAGSYTADFRADHLPSGVYLYKLQANGTVRTRTMTLQK